MHREWGNLQLHAGKACLRAGDALGGAICSYCTRYAEAHVMLQSRLLCPYFSAFRLLFLSRCSRCLALFLSFLRFALSPRFLRILQVLPPPIITT